MPLSEARWTHIAVPSTDLDRSVEFYTSLTPLKIVSDQSDDSGRSVWLSNEGQVETPFVLVLAQLGDDVGRMFGIEPGQPHRTLGPFAHIGIELPSKEEVDAVAERARQMGCLHWEPRFQSEHVGYICAATDPDGNVIEFSFNQRVFDNVRALWGNGAR